MEKTVPIPKFNEIDRSLTLETICEGYVTSHFILDNKKYVAVGAMGNGTGTGWKLIWIHEIIPLEIYTGELKPLDYGNHFHEVTAGNRPRSYTGMLVKCQGIQHVFVGEKITVKCSNAEKQLEVF